MSKKHYYMNFLGLFLKPSFIPLIIVIFTILTIIQFSGQLRDAEIELAGEKWVMIAIFMVVVEIFNQITYNYEKKHPKLPILKGVVLLFTFFVLTGLYLYRIMQLPIISDYSSISANISELFVNLLVSLFLPFYFFSSNVRFWLLYGTFNSSRC